MLIKALKNVPAKTVTVVAADVPLPDPALGYELLGEAFEYDPAGTVRLWTVLEAEALRAGMTDLSRYSILNKIVVNVQDEPAEEPATPTETDEPPAANQEEETPPAPVEEPAPPAEEEPA